MKSFKIVKVSKYGLYELENSDETIGLVFQFYGIESPKEGDTLLFSEKLTKRNWGGYSQPYSFELQEEYDLEYVKLNKNNEYMIMKTKEDNFILKRVYG